MDGRDANVEMLHFVWLMGNLNAVSLVACDLYVA